MGFNLRDISIPIFRPWPNLGGRLFGLKAKESLYKDEVQITSFVHI